MIVAGVLAEEKVGEKVIRDEELTRQHRAYIAHVYCCYATASLSHRFSASSGF
jgi:hypothetical protein